MFMTWLRIQDLDLDQFFPIILIQDPDPNQN